MSAKTASAQARRAARKWLPRFVASFVLLAVAAVVVVWIKLSALPAWYVVGDSARAGQEPPAAAAVGSKTYELRGFHDDFCEDGCRRLPPGIQASRLVVSGDRVEVGLVLSLAEFPVDRLREPDRSRVDQAFSVLPGLRHRKLHIGVSGELSTRDGWLRLGAEPKIVVGDLSLQLDTVASLLDVSPARLRRNIDESFLEGGLRLPRRAQREGS